MRPARRRPAGFTLLELLIAVAIFAILAVVAYSALSTVLSTRAHTDVQMKHLTQLQTAFTLMQRDIEQTVLRGVRDNFGDAEPALLGSNDTGMVLELTRLGWRNPTGQPRSFMQRVAYEVKDHSLVRHFWTELDRTQDSEPLDNDILDDIDGVDTKFLDQSNEWQTQWPPLSQGQAPAGGQIQIGLPRAIQVSVDTKYWGTVTWLFRVPG